MAEKKKEFRSFIGLVKYPVREGEVTVRDETVTVRNFVIRQVGVKEQAMDVRGTLWPSHDSFELEQGDLVFVEGAFDVRKGTKKDEDGNEVPATFFNLSVSGIKNFGPLDLGDRAPANRAGDTAEDDGDDIPW